jgi:amidophosphoribosyltransferase
MSVEEMCRFMGATSLAFLSVDGVYRALGYDHRDARNPQFTDHCFTGDYPTSLTDQHGPAHAGQLSLLSEVS